MSKSKHRGYYAQIRLPISAAWGTAPAPHCVVQRYFNVRVADSGLLMSLVNFA